MTQLLVMGTTILATGPFIDTGTEIRSPDCRFPKAVIPGYQIVNATVPQGFSVIGSTWDGTNANTAAAPQIVPQSVSRFQGLAALNNAGVLAQVQNVVNTSTDPLLPLAFNNSLTFDRTSPMLTTIAAQLGWTPAYVDQLFIAAAKITA